MRIFVTGATGFIGSNLCGNLIDHGHTVAILARQTDHWRLSPLKEAVTIIKGSLDDVDHWKTHLETYRPDAVVHLGWAGVGGEDRNDPKQADNIGWTSNLVAAAAHAGATVFVGAGSQAEYGPKSGVISSEASPEPTTFYGVTKLATGLVAGHLARSLQMRFVWMRIFSTYGEGDHPRWIIPGLIGKLLDGERPRLTAGEQLWDFVHVSDVSEAFRAGVEQPGARGIFNVGSGSAPPLRQTIETIRDLIDPDLPLGWGEIDYRTDQVMHLEADTEPLRLLGWKPQVELSDGLARCVSWYRDNPWIYKLV